jgi:hypothetical protein
VGLLVLAFVFAKYLPSTQWYYAILPALEGLYNIALFGRRIELDSQNKVIATSYFGLLKKIHAFERIYNFGTLRHMAYGIIHSGTDVSIIVVQVNQEKEIQLFSRIMNAKKNQIIIEEIKQILD